MTTFLSRRRPALRFTALCLASSAWLSACTTVGLDNPSASAPGPSRAAVQPAGKTPAPASAAQQRPVYSDATDAYDPFNPTRRVQDINQQEDLWARIRKGYKMEPLQDRSLVSEWEQRYASQPDYIARMTQRGSRYLYHIVDEVEARGMPSELALLPFVESAFNPTARSGAAAVGLWQFMPRTGRDFDLHQNMFKDDRRSVLSSTQAALDYLQMLHDEFGDWKLALAAYNWGQGNVRRAIARNAAAGLPTDYESLSMPAETRNYVPKLMAIRNLVANPAQFGVTLGDLPNHPYFLTVPVTRDIDVATVARLAGVSTDEFRKLNPEQNKQVIFAAGTPQILLPYDNALTFSRELSHYSGPLASLTAWVAPRTMKVADVARTLGVSVEELRAHNRLPARMMVRAGSTLVVPRTGAERNVSTSVLNNAHLALTPEPPPVKRVVFQANRLGMTVAAAARHAGVRPAQVAQWNGISPRGRFGKHASIVVYVPPNVNIAAIPEPPEPKKKSPKKMTAKERRLEAAREAREARANTRTARKASPKAAPKAAAKAAAKKERKKK
ncbi:transglycosylase SLT domain-containing protein [Amphibiibacter pelophylacis]|uniref:Transglycosylase SLT domain-containing protein n=1 Tax=Amphibiibacter pelophylacis TaxID=1799477 RepID=A0ACC6P3Z9_9BURK